MRPSEFVVVLVLILTGCRTETKSQPFPADELSPIEPTITEQTPLVLRARVISWDIGYRPPTTAEWLNRVVTEVRAARQASVDVMLWPELLAAGLGPYTPSGQRHAEYVTQQMSRVVLPAVQEAAGPDMLLVLGSYSHQEAGWTDAFNRAPLWLNGQWYFVDKIPPTPGERLEDPPIRSGQELPVFRFRGGVMAVAVCYTMEMPEIAVACKQVGVQLLLGPTATANRDGVARINRCAAARAVELGAAVLVAPLLGRQGNWRNLGQAAMYLPAQEGFRHESQTSEIREFGIHQDNFEIPWRSLLELRRQRQPNPEIRPFLDALGRVAVRVR